MGYSNAFNSLLKLQYTVTVVKSSQVLDAEKEAKEDSLTKASEYAFKDGSGFVFIYFKTTKDACVDAKHDERMKSFEANIESLGVGLNPFEVFLAKNTYYIQSRLFCVLECMFDEKKFFSDPATCQIMKPNYACAEVFIAGMMHTVISDLNIVEGINSIITGVINLVKTSYEKRDEKFKEFTSSILDYPSNVLTAIETVKNLSKKNEFSASDYETLFKTLYLFVLPPKPPSETFEMAINMGKNLYENYITDANCWRSGELTVMIAPIIFTGGVYAARRLPSLAGRFNDIFAGTNNLIDFFKAGKKLEKLEIPNGTNSKTNQFVAKGKDDQVENIYEEATENGQTVAKKICGSCLAQNTAVFGSNATLENLAPLTTVQTLETDGSIGTRNVWGKVGRKISEYASIWIKGERLNASTDHEFKTSEGWKPASYLKKGVLLFSLALNGFVPVDSAYIVQEPLQVEGLSLGNVQGYGVGSLGVVVAQSPRCLLNIKATKAAYEELQKLFPGSKLDEIIDIMDELPNTYTLDKLDNGSLRLIDNTNTPAKEWVEFNDNLINCKGGVDITTQTSLRNQFLNKKLLPNKIYEVDRYKYTTDAQGRVSKIEGELRDGPSRRDPTEQTNTRGLKNGNSTDDGGHMIGARFNGPVEQINYFPQDITSNRYGTWKNMENQWASKLSVNPKVKVEVEITPKFNGTSKRPYEFEVNYYYDGVKQTILNNPNYISPIPNP